MKPAKVTYFINSIGMKLVRIEPGTFLMGLPDNMTNSVGPYCPAGWRPGASATARCTCSIK